MVLQRYISHLILTYAAKYIRNIETHLNLGLWGGDITLNNLEARLDVLQHSLAIPAAFTLSRGFIKELRIHIPWSAILTKPVEVTLTGVECVLHFNPHASDPQPATPPLTPHSQPVAAGGSELVETESSGGWATDLILKILANLSITLHDLSIKYHESTHTTLCLRLPLFTLHSTDPSWRSREFMDLLGAWRLMHKVCRLEGCSVFLYDEREGGDSVVRDDEVCILDGLTVSVRVKSYLAALGASVDTSSWPATSATVPSTPITLLPVTSPTSTSASASSSSPSASPAAAGPPPSSQALPRPLPPPCGPAISVDIHVQDSVTLHLSSDQFDRLHAMVKSKADFYATSAAAARVAQSIAAVPAAIAKGQTDNTTAAHHIYAATRTHKHKRPGQPTPTSALTQSHSTELTATTTAKESSVKKREKGERKEREKGWMSWMWEFVAAEEDDDPDSAASATSGSSGSTAAGGGGSGGVVREKEDRFDFQRVMGHLAPTEEILFCFHLSSISLHLKNDRTDLTSLPTTAVSLSLPSIDSDSPLSSTRLHSDSLVAPLPPSPQSSVNSDKSADVNGTNVTTLNGSGLVPSSPWLPSVSSQSVLSAGVSVDRSTALTFARLEIHGIGMILSQPLVLSKPTSSTAQHSRTGSGGSHLSSPSTLSHSPTSSASTTTPAVKPPTFCVNVESVTVSVKDSPTAAPRAVLRFGPDSASSLASPSLSPASHTDSSHPPPLQLNGGDVSASGVYRLHVSKARGRHAPFPAASCLHRNKYWERVHDAGEQQHLLYALSIFHTVKAAYSAELPSVLPQWVACFDVLLGPLSLGVDWSSGGTERLIAQLLTFAKTVQETDETDDESPTLTSMRALSSGLHKLPTVLSSAADSPFSSEPSTPTMSTSPTLCWLQLKCAVPDCDGYILGNPCPGHGEDGTERCRKSVVRRPCRHYTAHVEVACLPY